MVLNHEKKSILLCESLPILIDRRTLILKNNGKLSFLYGTKASLSFIPMRKMCLWCPIMKRKEIITRIHDYPN